MQISNELISQYMHPVAGKVCKPENLPTYSDKNKLEWSNSDEQWSISLDLNTGEISGTYYDWNEASEDWEDTEPMADEEILSLIKSHKILAVKF